MSQQPPTTLLKLAREYAQMEEILPFATVDAWKLGKSLAVIRQRAFKGEWRPWLDGIQMGRETARRFMELSKIDNAQIVRYPTVDAALMALKAPKPPQPPIEGTAASTRNPTQISPASTAKSEKFADLNPGRVARRQLGWVDADGLAESNGC